MESPTHLNGQFCYTQNLNNQRKYISPIQLKMVLARYIEAFPHLVFIFLQPGTESLKSPAVLTLCNNKLKFSLIKAKVYVHEDLN